MEIEGIHLSRSDPLVSSPYAGLYCCTFTFPPENAPKSFKAAWAASTDGMLILDIPTHVVFAVCLANIRYERRLWTGGVDGNPATRTGAIPTPTPITTTKTPQGMIPQEHYRHDMEFHTRLTKAMG